MGGRRAVRVALATALLAAAAACSPSSAERANTGATVPTEPPTTTTTNPYDVPAVIDEAYVNRVLAGLDAVLGDVTRLVVSTRTIPPDAYDRLRSVYGDDEFLQLTIDSIQSDLRRGLSSYRAEPGNRISTARQILFAGEGCLFAEVWRDYSAVSTSPNPVDPQWVGLRMGENIRDPAGYNPTSWVFIYDGFPRDRLTPENPCTT